MSDGITAAYDDHAEAIAWCNFLKIDSSDVSKSYFLSKEEVFKVYAKRKGVDLKEIWIQDHIVELKDGTYFKIKDRQYGCLYPEDIDNLAIKIKKRQEKRAQTVNRGASDE